MSQRGGPLSDAGQCLAQPNLETPRQKPSNSSSSFAMNSVSLPTNGLSYSGGGTWYSCGCKSSAPIAFHRGRTRVGLLCSSNSRQCIPVLDCQSSKCLA